MNSDFAITEERYVDDRLHVWVDTDKAHYQGIKWHDLNGMYKRKFETLIILTKPQDRPVVHYQ